MACRETRHKGFTLCNMLCERRHKRSVGIFDYGCCIPQLIVITSLVGFEELGNNDAFTTAALELRLSVCGVFFSWCVYRRIRN